MVLAVVGVGGAVLGIGGLMKTQTKMENKERELRLAHEKYEEIITLTDFATPSGDFTDRSDNAHLWEMTTTPITLPQSASTNAAGGNAATSTSQGQLLMLTVTVHPSTSNAPGDSESVSGVVWETAAALNGTSASPTGGG
jgi:hypothetical protein